MKDKLIWLCRYLGSASFVGLALVFILPHIDFLLKPIDVSKDTESSTSDVEDCRYKGLCRKSIIFPFLNVGSNKSCRKSLDCGIHGRCSVGLMGMCEPKTNMDCVSSNACGMDGACSIDEHPFWINFCIAKTDFDCKGSDRCKTYGDCSAVDGWCVKK